MDVGVDVLDLDTAAVDADAALCISEGKRTAATSLSIPSIGGGSWLILPSLPSAELELVIISKASSSVSFISLYIAPELGALSSFGISSVISCTLLELGMSAEESLLDVSVVITSVSMMLRVVERGIEGGNGKSELLGL
jgi:hypothetical protein